MSQVTSRTKNCFKSMNLCRSLAIFDSIGCKILLVCVPAEEAEAFFRDPLGAITWQGWVYDEYKECE